MLKALFSRVNTDKQTYTHTYTHREKYSDILNNKLISNYSLQQVNINYCMIIRPDFLIATVRLEAVRGQ